jgi:hypothetical protein
MNNNNHNNKDNNNKHGYHNMAPVVLQSQESAKHCTSHKRN